VKHYGDITKINGAEIEPVDVITGGSPCQDLSVAGKRAGLAGERSGLFMEQIRIVKEMRAKEIANGRTDCAIRPRFMVWENVPGAFSSNNGKDFQAVLTEIVRIVEPDAPDVPMPDKGKWTKSGCIYDEMGRWSVAWRVHDAQFWGVPQRRKRIALVADFGGLAAPEVLFERKGLSRNLEQGKAEREETAGEVGVGIEGASGFPLGFRPENVRLYDETATTICNGTRPGFTCGVVQNAEPIVLESNQNHATITNNGISSTLPASMGMGGVYVPMITAYGIDQQGGKGGANYTEDVCPPILSDSHGTPHAVAYGISSYGSNAMKSPSPHSGIYEASTAVAIGNGQVDQLDLHDKVGALNCMYDQQAVICGTEPIVYKGDSITSPINAANPQEGDPCHTLTEDDRNYLVYENHSQDSRYKPLGEISETVNAKYGTGGNNQPLVVSDVLPFDTTQVTSDKNWSNPHYGDPCHPLAAQAHVPSIASPSVVRRLTPLECERLQGYPDGWTDIGEWTDSKGKKHQTADSARYKALGNSIALPFWKVLARRISAQYDRDITMGSLFDGIGGFPLAFEHCGGKAVWASEIEEFPIAVTKVRFPEPDNSKE